MEYKALIYLLFIFFLLTPTIVEAQAVGDRIKVNHSQGLNTRSCAGMSCSLKGVHPNGDLGTVIGGPVVADGVSWININYDKAPDGWSGAAWVVKLTDTNAPTAPAEFFAR